MASRMPPATLNTCWGLAAGDCFTSCSLYCSSSESKRYAIVLAQRLRTRCIYEGATFIVAAAERRASQDFQSPRMTYAEHLMFHRVIPVSVLAVVAAGFAQSIWMIVYKPWSKRCVLFSFFTVGPQGFARSGATIYKLAFSDSLRSSLAAGTVFGRPNLLKSLAVQ